MKINGNQAVCAIRNIHGALVFVPEKIKINGNLYVCPIEVGGFGTFQSLPTVFSFTESIDVNIIFNGQYVTFSEPFTKSIFLELIKYGAKNRSKPALGKRGNPLKMSSSQYQQFIENNQS